MSTITKQAASEYIKALDFDGFVKDSKFMAIENTDDATLSIGNLSNKDQPLLEESQFQDLKAGDYTAMKQSLRLAIPEWLRKLKISRKRLDYLIQAIKSQDDTPLRLTAQFNFAITLLHELTHVCDYFVRGCKNWSHFFGDRCHNEIGFELENFLFGGILTLLYDRQEDCERYTHNNRPSKVRGVVGLWEHPYQLQVQAYVAAGENNGDILVKEEPKVKRPFDMAWRVPLSFLQNFFEDDFWNRIGTEGSSILKPARVDGFCFRTCVDEGEIVSLPVDIQGQARTLLVQHLYVPAGYRRHKGGDIAKVAVKAAASSLRKRKPSEEIPPERQSKRLRKRSPPPDSD